MSCLFRAGSFKSFRNLRDLQNSSFLNRLVKDLASKVFGKRTIVYQFSTDHESSLCRFVYLNTFTEILANKKSLIFI